MRGALPVKGTRLPIASPGLRWPAWASIRIPRRRPTSGEELETIERLSSELRRARRSGEYRPEFGPRGWR
jgi:hypothetical protein